jgi:hypothetical protein
MLLVHAIESIAHACRHRSDSRLHAELSDATGDNRSLLGPYLHKVDFLPAGQERLPIRSPTLSQAGSAIPLRLCAIHFLSGLTGSA